MDIVAFIFARGGSKGLPGKNTRELMGRPLLAWAIDHAFSVKRIGRVIVSTDSREIAEVALSHGADVPFIRPAELAQDNSPEWLAWQHALNYLKQSGGALPDAMVSVPTTSPLRSVDDIDRCLDEYQRSSPDIVITVTTANRNPYFNMVEVGSDGQARVVMRSHESVTRRQDAPSIYDMTTVAYVARPSFVLEHSGIFEGHVRSVFVPRERSVDIDTLVDFQFAEFLLNARERENEVI